VFVLYLLKIISFLRIVVFALKGNQQNLIHFLNLETLSIRRFQLTLILKDVENRLEFYLNKEPSSGFKVASDKVIEADHVLFLGELDVVGDVLQNLRHQHQAPFDVLWK
jgi:hypothetical protein